MVVVNDKFEMVNLNKIDIYNNWLIRPIKLIIIKNCVQHSDNQVTCRVMQRFESKSFLQLDKLQNQNLLSQIIYRLRTKET